jgi:integrase
MKEQEVLQHFFDLQTCSERRLNKIKNVMSKSKEIIKKDLTKLELIDITKFLREINNSDYRHWTKNDFKKIFKSFLKWHYKKDFLEWANDDKFKIGFKTLSKKKAFNKEKINKNTLIKPEELEILLRTSKSLKWKALLTLLYESAFRPCEIVNLRWQDLNFDDSRNLCSVRTTSPKTKETREVPVQDCIVHLKRWKDEFEFLNRTEKDFVFPNPNNREEHLSENGITILIKRLCRKAGIREIYPYIFRHSRIYFIQKRLGARIASKYAGHSLETSEIYDHLDSDDVEEAMLQKVYVTEELSPEKKHELEQKIEKQNTEIQDLKDDMKNLIELVNEKGAYKIYNQEDVDLEEKDGKIIITHKN